jgi:hypothetical protein
MNNGFVVIPGRIISYTYAAFDFQMLNIQTICSFRHYKLTPLNQLLDAVFSLSDIERCVSHGTKYSERKDTKSRKYS